MEKKEVFIGLTTGGSVYTVLAFVGPRTLVATGEISMRYKLQTRKGGAGVNSAHYIHLLADLSFKPG